MNKNEKICIGWIDGGTVHTGFASHISKILLNRNEVISDIVCASGPYLSNNRNLMVEMFLETDADWLLSLDSDLVIGVDSFDILIENADKTKYPILGGAYYLPLGNGNNVVPSAMKMNESGKGGTFLTFDDVEHADGIITNLHSVGGGFALIHRSVFEKIKDHTGEKMGWFKDEYREELDSWISDDVYFYATCRALNINISFHPKTTSFHLKTFKLGYDTFKNYAALNQQGHNHDHGHNHGDPNAHQHEHPQDWMPNKKFNWWTKKKKVN